MSSKKKFFLQSLYIDIYKFKSVFFCFQFYIELSSGETIESAISAYFLSGGVPCEHRDCT